MFFSFAGVGNSVCPGAMLDYFPGELVGESHVVCDAYLFILQFHASSFGASWRREMVPLFSVQCSIGRFSMGRVYGVTEFDSY
jgi:hypothetical protein